MTKTIRTPEETVSNRAETVRQERRRKPGAYNAHGQKLGVDEGLLDRENFHYRWVNDTPGRVQALHAQDYDPAPEVGAKPDGNGLGSVSSALAGVQDNGTPYNAVLMRKPKWMHEEDQALKQRPVDQIEETIRRGDTSGQNIELKGRGVYTPGTGNNTIERG